jgi:hypothetical protein
LDEWLPEATGPDRLLFFKRLSSNDTGASGAHQVGLYVPNRFAFVIAPELSEPKVNPRRAIDFRLLSHRRRSAASLIHYNNRLRGGTRNECRLTGFGGRDYPLQDPDNTSALLVISFHASGTRADAWLSRNLAEDEYLEASLGGVVEPGVVGYSGRSISTGPTMELAGTRWMDPVSADELPDAWRSTFPSTTDLTREAVRRVPAAGMTVDSRLEGRHAWEFALFQGIEAHHLQPVLEAGFSDAAEFLAAAQAVLQRRKSRAGRSLEQHLAAVFNEEGVAHEAQKETEPGHRPDFLFPSVHRYRNAPAGASDLDMLAVKSTLRDRWRQVLKEADKIPEKHLFTLDEGVSENQYRQIRSEGIRLVVPAGRIPRFPRSVRGDVLSLGSFVTHRLRKQGTGS